MSVRRSIALLILVTPLTASYRVSYDDKNVYESLDKLAEIMTLAQANSPDKVESKLLVEGAIGGLLEQLDPHTSYYNQDRYTTMQEDQHGSFFGIGIIVGTQNDKLTIISPLSGAPAAMAGMRAGDVIVKIGTVETAKMLSSDAVRLLRGSEGTTVDLEVLRSGIDNPLNFTLTRASIPSLAVRTSFMADDTTGYVALKEFAETATDEVAAALDKLTALGMKQVILDLRGNPGGLLPQAISISSLFLEPEKLVVSTKGRLKNANQKFFTQARKTYEDLPLVLLIDRGSASASEIVAGAIQDHDRGLILGISSWGKGLVQSVFPLGDGDTGLALTTARYYTPSGRNIQGDYSSLEDYYNPKSARDIFFGTGEEEVISPYKTAHGRTVLQTRGITPDVFLSSPDEPENVTELEGRHNAFFNFVTTWQALPESITRDFIASDEMVDRFQVWLQEKEFKAGDLKPYREILRQKLTYQTLYTATSEDSEAMAWRYRMTQDLHVRAAIELFPRASELLSVYKGESNMRPEYNSELRAFSKERDTTRQSAALEIKKATKN